MTRAPHLHKAVRLKREDIGADGTFAGYGSVFGTVDAGNDIVEPGAFAASLATHQRNGTTVKLLWQHDPSEPIGVWLDLHEDGRGLYCKGKLLLEFDRARQAHALLRHGAIDGLSIGYDCKVFEIEGEASASAGPYGLPCYGGGAPSIRRLKEIDLWEVSLVTFPMNAESRVATVKRDREAPAGLGCVRELAELARILREVNRTL